MDKIKGIPNSTIEALAYLKNGLSDSVAVRNAAIKVENINGPIPLLSEADDEVWPSAMMSDMIENRIKMNNFILNLKTSNMKMRDN